MIMSGECGPGCRKRVLTVVLGRQYVVHFGKRSWQKLLEFKMHTLLDSDVLFLREHKYKAQSI